MQKQERPLDRGGQMKTSGSDGDPETPAADAGQGQAASSRDEDVDLAECLCRIAEDRDESAFREVYVHVAPSIKRYMMSKGADGATAEELAQEALARVWNKAHSFRPSRGNATTWIFGIARNLRIDRIRRERVWLFSQELPENHDEQPSPEKSPEELASESERMARVREAVAQLPEDQRQVIALSFIDGLSHSEISARLDLPLGTIKSRIRAAYQNLRPLLREHG